LDRLIFMHENANSENRRNKVLISTLPGGGVETHTKYVVSLLKEKGYEITLAYYQPYSISPQLSVPFWQVGRKLVKKNKTRVNGIDVYEIGAWLPELEFTHYWATSIWKKLIDDHDAFLAISGSALPALPFMLTSHPFLSWVGTPYEEDRKDRVKSFPFFRRGLDFFINSHVCKYLEKKILDCGNIIPTNDYVKKKLQDISSSHGIKDPIGIPVNTNFFKSNSDQVIPNKVGFIGRYNDQRKNIFLLIDAIKVCHDKGVKITLDLIGGTPSAPILDYIKELKLETFIDCRSTIPLEDLPDAYQTFSVFVIPSHQEGLCIAGLEAMACGCPVISTACGGPEVYIKNDHNGYIVDWTPRNMAEKIVQVVSSREIRQFLSLNARKTVETQFSREIISNLFWNEFEQVFKTV